MFVRFADVGLVLAVLPVCLGLVCCDFCFVVGLVLLFCSLVCVGVVV